MAEPPGRVPAESLSPRGAYVTTGPAPVTAAPLPSPLTLASESRLAGSAGTTTSTVRVSTAITPTGMPPSLRGGAQVSRAAGPTRPQLIPLGVPGAGSNGRGGGQRTAPGVVTGRLFYWKAKHRPKDVRASQLAGRKGPAGGLIGTQPSGESGARPVQGLKQLCLLELSMTTATFSVCASNTVATSHVWLRGLGMWRVQPGS